MTSPDPQDSSGVYPFRVYTLQVGGNTYEKAFPHPEGLRGSELNLWLHREFHQWVLSEFSHHEGDGFVTHIAFTDRMRERISPPSRH